MKRIITGAGMCSGETGGMSVGKFFISTTDGPLAPSSPAPPLPPWAAWLPDLPSARYEHTMAALEGAKLPPGLNAAGGVVLVIGGLLADTTAPGRTVEMFNLESLVWGPGAGQLTTRA